MLSYTVRRSIDIHQSQAEIITFLGDYTNWPTWSPWLIQEPNCPLSYSDSQGQVGDGYEWNGELVGAGKMTLIEKSERRLLMDLEFLRPFKSCAKVEFEVQPINAEGDPRCEVSWIMHGSVPWFLFFLKNMFKNWIAMDYDRGLTMLKSQIETGHVHSKLEVIGKRSQDEIHYIAIKGKATIAELGPVMQNHFCQLEEYFENHKIEAVGPPFAIYEKMDKATTASDFYSCFPIAHKHAIDEPFIYKVMPACETYVVKHTGEYPFVGNGWACAMGASRHHKVKVKFKPMGMEKYLNDPDEVEAKALETEIILFAK